MSKKKTVKAPLTHNPGKGRPKEHLAYLNYQEMEALKRLNGHNVERGPKGLPSFATSGPSSSLNAPARTAPSTGTVKSTSTSTGARGPTGPAGQPRTSPAGGTAGAVSRAPSTPTSRPSTSATGPGGMFGGSSSSKSPPTTTTGARGPTGPAGQPRTSPAGGTAGAVTRSSDTTAQQTVATNAAKVVTQNRSLQQDASKAGVRSINVGPMGTPVNLPRTTVSNRAAGNISRIAEQAKFPSRGYTVEPPKATTDINAMTMSAKKAIGTPATNPNYARDYAKVMADRDAQIRRLTAPTPKSLATVTEGASYVNPDMPDSVKKLLAERGYNPDGTKMQKPATMPGIGPSYPYATGPSYPYSSPAVPTPPPAIDPSIAGRIAEANKNYKIVSSGPYATSVYSDPDLQRGPTFGDTVSGYARGLYDTVTGGIGSLFSGDVGDIPEAMRTPLDAFKVPGLTYEEPSSPDIRYKGLADYIAGDAAMRRAIMAKPAADMYGIDPYESLTSSGISGVQDAFRAGKAAMYPVQESNYMYGSKGDLETLPTDAIGTTRELRGTKNLGSEGAQALVLTNILNKVDPETSKLIPDRLVTPYTGQMSPYTVSGNESIIQKMSPAERILAIENVSDPSSQADADAFRRVAAAMGYKPEDASQIDLRVGPNYVPEIGFVEDFGHMGPFNTDRRRNPTFFKAKSKNPLQDVTPTEEAEAAQAETVTEAKKARKGTGAVLNAVAPGLGTLVSGGLWLADRQMQKLVDRYQNAGITERAEMERKYPNLIPRANQMGIPTGNDPDVANQIYREWANRTRMPAEGRGGSSSNPPPATSGGGGGGAPATGGGGGTSGESSGGRPYIYYQWDLGVNIPSPGDSNYTLYQKYLAERAAAQAAMYA